LSSQTTMITGGRSYAEPRKTLTHTRAARPTHNKVTNYGWSTRESTRAAA
jgi:hypothetical protein